MPSQETLEFAKLFVRNVRDPTIRSSDDRLLVNSDSNPIVRLLGKAKSDGNFDPIYEAITYDVVDCTIVHFLRAIDKGVLQLSFTASNGKKIDLTEAGHGRLASSYVGEDGWLAKYAGQPFKDPDASPTPSSGDISGGEE